jgi:hypothetical protein
VKSSPQDESRYLPNMTKSFFNCILSKISQPWKECFMDVQKEKDLAIRKKRVKREFWHAHIDAQKSGEKLGTVLDNLLKLIDEDPSRKKEKKDSNVTVTIPSPRTSPRK